MRQLTKYLALAAAVSMLASIAAVQVYEVIAWHERPLTFDLPQLFFLGFPIGLRGLVLALPGAATLFFLRARLSRPSFVCLAAAGGALLGVVLAFSLRGNADHISPL